MKLCYSREKKFRTMPTLELKQTHEPVENPGVTRRAFKSAVCSLNALLVWLLFCPSVAPAGPPYETDDPEPVEYRHWEFYLASQHSYAAGGWSGTAPHVEINYGVITNVQLHLIAPLSYTAPLGGGAQYGYGDTELGVKYRFIQESSRCPMVGTFPLLEIPTGNARRGLGNGKLQAFLPIWLQKSFGKWTTCGGGGYGINPGAGNRDWWFLGWQAQRQVLDNLALGAEIYHRSAMREGEESDTDFNLGMVLDMSDRHHLLLSAGRAIAGPTRFQIYFAYQLTFGPGR